MAKGKIKAYTRGLLRVANHRAFWLRVLGEVNNQQIWLIRTRESHIHKDPKVLIVAGFHGEEKAGPLGILKWLENSDRGIFKKIDLSFIPVVNPTGFNRGVRKNSWGEKTNCGFVHKTDKLSKEGRILNRNIKFLTELAKDGFLSLHEDEGEKNFYVYSYEDVDKPSEAAYALRNVEAKYFKKLQNGIKVNEEGDPEAAVEDGIIHKLCDGSLEDYFMHKGIRAFVTETPGKCRISRRIEATMAIINKFIDLSLGG